MGVPGRRNTVHTTTKKKGGASKVMGKKDGSPGPIVVTEVRGRGD